jgi:hypothetical protein
MADLADIRIGIDVETGDVARAVQMFESFKRKTAQLKLELNKGNITNKAYNRSVQQMAIRLGQVTGNTNQAKSAMMKYQYAIKDATDEQLRFTTASGKGMRRMEILAQQAGYQIGDLAVQIQSGTNAAVALGQQGSQLLGFFGPMGAIAGAGLAIATGLIAPFLKAKDSIEDANKALEDFENRLEKIREERLELTTGFDPEVAAVSEERAQIAGRIAELELRSTTEAGLRLELTRNLITQEEERLSKLTQQLQNQLRQEKTDQQIIDNVKEQNELLEKQASVRKSILEAAQDLETNFEIANNKVKDAIDLAVRENSILRMRVEGKHTEAEIQKEIDRLEREKLDASLKILGIEPGIRDQRVVQLRIQQDLVKKLKEEEEIRKRVAKIAFSDLGMTEGMAALSYQQYGQLREKGAKTKSSKGTKGTKGKTPAESMASIIKGMEQQANLQRKLVGLSDQESDYLQILYDLKEKNKDASGKMTEAQLKQAAERIAAINAETAAMEAQMQKIQDVADSFETHFGDALMGIVTDFDFLNGSIEDFGYNAEQVFKNMAREIIKELYRIFVVKKITGFISGAVGDVASLYQGSTGFIQFSADGGGYTGSGPRSGGLDGKGGFLAMLHPKETVIDHTKGQSAEGVTVVQNINISTGVQQTVRNEIRTLMPQIANSAKAAVSDAKRRGGSYGRALS